MDARTRARRPVGRSSIIVQNMTVPLDRRVWNECRALLDAGYRVSVRLPQGSRRSDHDVTSTACGCTSTRRPRRQTARRPSPSRSVYCWLRAALAGPAHPPAGAGRRHAGVQPARHLLAARRRMLQGAPASGSSSTTTTCAPRSTGPAAGATTAGSALRCWRWSGPPSGPPIHVISTNESYRRSGVRRTGRPPARPRSCAAGPAPASCARAAPTARSGAATATCVPTSGSWATRTGWTPWCGSPTSSSTSGAATTSASPCWATATCLDRALRDHASWGSTQPRLLHRPGRLPTRSSAGWPLPTWACRPTPARRSTRSRP